MKLYELTGQFRRLEQMASDGDFEPDELALYVDSLETQWEEKAESVAIVIQELGAEANALQTEAERLRDRAASVKHHADRLKEYLHFEMGARKVKHVDGKVLKIRLQRSPTRVEVIDPDVVPLQYISADLRMPQDVAQRYNLSRWTRSTRVEKKDILDDSRAGAEIPGVEIVQEQHVRIR